MWSVGTEWNWAALPDDFAQTMLASGVLVAARRLVVLAGEHAHRYAQRSAISNPPFLAFFCWGLDFAVSSMDYCTVTGSLPSSVWYAFQHGPENARLDLRL